ncbi:MAG: inositol monophosphatase family protein [archaeon]
MKYKEFAIKVALDAGKLLMDNYGKIQSLEYKLKTNFKIGVDCQSDNLIRKAIVENFPEHNIYSEENNPREKQSEFSWVIDPLDGTLPFTYRISDHFSVAISLVNKKTPILGVIYAPKRGELYVAEKGKGAFCNDLPIKVSSVTDVNKAMVALDYGKFMRQRIADYHRRLLSDDGVTYPFTYGCASVSLALVAAGKLDGYLALKLEPWDMAAGVILNREVGSKVTTIDGKDWQFGDESILAANPSLHRKLLEVLSGR